jgi:hypothetical protein
VAVAVSIYEEMQKMREGEMKIIKIEKCGECKDTIENRFCYPQSETFGRLIKIDPETIHPDCPLEDAKEAGDAQG